MSEVERKIRIVSSKKAYRRKQFTEISGEYIKVVDRLIAEARKLSDEDRHEDAKSLLDTTETLLKSIRKYQELVGEILAETG